MFVFNPLVPATPSTISSQTPKSYFFALSVVHLSLSESVTNHPPVNNTFLKSKETLIVLIKQNKKTQKTHNIPNSKILCNLICSTGRH